MSSVGLPLPLLPDVERELPSVASSWTDDAVLAASPLADLAGGEEAEHARAEAVRRLFREALAAARAAAPDRGAAFKAVEMAYLDRSVSHERVAERMAVSRSTFYRLLKRGIQGMAWALVQGWEGIDTALVMRVRPPAGHPGG